MAVVTLSAAADTFKGTTGDDAVIAADATLSGADQLQGDAQFEADIVELRNAGNGIFDAQFAGLSGFEILEITDTITATVSLTLGLQASEAFSFSQGPGGDPTFAPKAYINASNMTGQQSFILNASQWTEPAATLDRGLRVSLGAGANNVILTGFDDRILLLESLLGSNDKINGGAGFDVLVMKDNGASTLGDSLFSGLTSIEMLRLGDFLPGSASSGNFKVILGAQSEAAGIKQIDSRFNNGQLIINAAQRDSALTIDGASGADNILGTKGSDIIRGNGGNDELFGNGGNDQLTGGIGDDQLTGGIGADRMAGGKGNDRYFVDSAGDQVTEKANDGIDRVFSFVSLTLGTGLEQLELLGGGNINGGGNGGNNLIIGNSGSNKLSGGAGDDMLAGGLGNDILIGGVGRDALNGGGGDDTLLIDRSDAIAHGGAGFDTINLDAFGATLKLSQLVGKVFDGVEQIDLSGTHDNTLIVDPASIGAGTLTIKGDTGDSLVISGAWVKGAPSGGFDVYTNGGATIKVETDVTVYASTIDLSTLNGNTGFRLNGEAAGDVTGYSVSSAGDVNGDGFADFLIGAYKADASGNDSGSVYLVFGSAKDFGATFDLAGLDGTNGFRFNGVAAGDHAGYSVASIGDFNGDGFADLIVGAPYADLGTGPESGVSYVVFGGTANLAAFDNEDGKADGIIDLGKLTSAFGFNMAGEDAQAQLGFSVACAGDVNGDGFDDLIVGAYNANVGSLTYAGAAYVVFGNAAGTFTTLDVFSLSGSDGFRLQGGQTNDYAGNSVKSAGDVNGDGFDDLFVGAYGYDIPGHSDYTRAGGAYIVFGKADWSGAANFELSTLNGTNGYKFVGAEDGDNAGWSVSAAGDFNGDGFDDLIIGARYADRDAYNSYTGAAYVLFGGNANLAALDKADGTTDGAIELSQLNGVTGFKLNGIVTEDYVGESVSSAGDFNGDGFADIIVSGYGTDPDSVNDAGAAFVIFGKASGFAAEFDVTALDGSNGFRLDGTDLGEYAGQSVSSAGDVNGDGFDDLLIGAPHAGTNVGAAFIVYGGNFTGAVIHLGTAGNDVLVGTKAAETFVGDLGNDSFISNGGLDSFQGGQGADMIRLSGAGFRHIDGGSGKDTIRLDGAGINFDLTAIPQARIEDIERINITGSGNNTLRLTVRDVLDLSDTSNTLIVDGNVGDVVHRGGGWVNAGLTTIGAQTYRVFESGEATLLIDQDVTKLI